MSDWRRTTMRGCGPRGNGTCLLMNLPVENREVDGRLEVRHVYPKARVRRAARRRLSVDLPMVEWSAAYDRASADERRIIDDQAAAAATRYARLSAYISRRLSGGPHADAVKRQNQAARKVRQALGFTYKDDAISF